MLARRGVYIFGSFASRVKAWWDNWDLKKVCIGHSRVALITLATFFGTYGIFGNPVAAAVCGFLAFVLGHGFIFSLLYEGKVRRYRLVVCLCFGGRCFQSVFSVECNDRVVAFCPWSFALESFRTHERVVCCAVLPCVLIPFRFFKPVALGYPGNSYICRALLIQETRRENICRYD